MLHNVSNLFFFFFFFCDLQVTTDLFRMQETVSGNVYCTYTRLCVHRGNVFSEFLFLLFTVEMTL